MSAIIKDFVFTSYVFWVCLGASIILLALGLFLPPVGQIDNSVLIGVGEICGLATLGVFAYCVKAGVTAKFSKGDISVEVTQDK